MELWAINSLDTSWRQITTMLTSPDKRKRVSAMGDFGAASAIVATDTVSATATCVVVTLSLDLFELQAKVKWVKAGRRMIEGWVRKVLRMPRCQTEATPSRSPGRSMKAMVAAAMCASF